METSENNLYYCIIVKYTMLPKSEQEKSSYFLVMYTDRNDFPCSCRFLWRIIYRWCLSLHGVVFALSQLISGFWVFLSPSCFVIMFFPVCTLVLQKLFIFQLQASCNLVQCSSLLELHCTDRACMMPQVKKAVFVAYTGIGTIVLAQLMSGSAFSDRKPS